MTHSKIINGRNISTPIISAIDHNGRSLSLSGWAGVDDDCVCQYAIIETKSGGGEFDCSFICNQLQLAVVVCKKCNDNSLKSQSSEVAVG
jgi:hypothetical protein